MNSNHCTYFTRLLGALTLVLFFNLDTAAQTEKSTPQGKVVSADFMKEFSDDFEVFSVGVGVNSEFNEYNPVMSHDGIYMLFTSRNDSTTGKKTDADDGEYREDINLAKWKNGRYSTNNVNGEPLELFTTRVNTNKHEAPVYISENEETIILFKDNDLWYSSKEGDGFTEPVKYPKSINFKYYHRHASLTADGKTMYFTAEVLDKKLNKFHFDIYKTELNDDGQWSKPEALPSAVNTLFNEDSPEISADGKTLFFSSDRTDGYGGYDIYYYKLETNSETIYRLDQPINSAAHDIYFKMLADSSAAFLSSNRLKGYGGMDIYKVSFFQQSANDCASDDKGLRINGADSVLVGSRLILTTDGSLLDDQKPRKVYWTIDGELQATGRRFEKPLTEVGQFVVRAEVNTLDSVNQSFKSGCVQKLIQVVSDSVFNKNSVTQRGLSKLREGVTENELLLAIPVVDSALDLKNDVVTTYTNTPVYINALDNDPAIKSGNIALTAVSRPGHGSNVIENNKKGVILYYPTKDFNGTDAFSYSAVNDSGLVGKAWVGIRVLDNQPFVYSKIVREDTAYTLMDKAVSINVFENDIMKEGVRYKVAETTPPQNGEIKGIDLNNGVFIYQPRENYIGQDVFTYAVDDPDAGRQRTFVRVNIGMDSSGMSIARTSPDFASTFQSNMVSFNVLLNDAFDADDQPRIISVSKTAMGATQIYDAKLGTIVYAPLTSFIGYDNFTYTVELADGSRHVEAVSISVMEEEILASVDSTKEETEILAITEVDEEKINTKDRPDIALKSIYFDFDKTYIRSDARKLMAENIEVLKDNPTAVIQIISHCDSRGSKAYNMLLSARRAKSTVSYLTARGIDESRIVAAVGVGEDNLINDCGDGVPCPNFDHQKNRRSDFIIVGSLK